MDVHHPCSIVVHPSQGTGSNPTFKSSPNFSIPREIYGCFMRDEGSIFPDTYPLISMEESHVKFVFYVPHISSLVKWKR